MLHILACCAIYSPLPAPPLGAFLIISTNFARGVMVFMKIFLEQDVTYLPYERAFSYVYVTSQN